MKTEHAIKQDVLEELAFDPSVGVENLDVVVQGQTVTLHGFVPSLADKAAAEKAVLRVGGVRALVDALQLRIPSSSERADQDLAHAAVTALEWHSAIPEGVEVSVEQGRVILRGSVDWTFQKEAASNALKYLYGIKEIVNHLKVRPKPQVSDIKDKIENALARTARREANQIKVDVTGSKVTLRGHVLSYAEIKDASAAAWSVPGVSEVDSRLSVTNQRP